jgi:glycyl-tRNA synthetase
VPSPAPEYNFAIIPEVTTRDAFWEMKKHPKHVTPVYEDIWVPKNTGAGVAIGILALAVGLGIVWHIWWHYARGCADVEYRFPFGQSELEGIANRADFDLKQHMEWSGKDLRYFDDQATDPEQKRFLPHVIEPSAGADRATLAFLCDAYTEDEVGGEQRTVLKLHPRLAPYKAAIFPLVKKEGMPEKAQAIAATLRKRFNVMYDEKGAIGRRYRRQDEAGTPFCVTVDGDSLTDDTVTVRERDGCTQERIAADRLSNYLAAKIGA